MVHFQRVWSYIYINDQGQLQHGAFYDIPRFPTMKSKETIAIP